MDPPGHPPSRFQQSLGVFGSLGAAFRVYFANANSLFLIVAIFMIPATVLTALLVRITLPDELLNFDPNSFDPNSGRNPFPGLDFADIRSLVAAGFVSVVLIFVATMVSIGACFSAIHESLDGAKPDWRSSIRAALGKTRSLIWIPILMSLLFMGASFLGVILIGILGAVQELLAALGIVALVGGFVYFFVSWSLAVPILMAEDARGRQALTRSRELVSRDWWPTFAIYLLAFILLIIVSAALGAIFTPQAQLSDQSFFVSVLGSVVNNIVFTPFQAALVGVVYFNLRSKSPAGPMPGTPMGPSFPPPPPPPPPAS